MKSTNEITQAHEIPIDVSRQDLAGMLGITPRHLDRLARAGWIEGKADDGRFNLKRAVQSYLGYCAWKGQTSH